MTPPTQAEIDAALYYARWLTAPENLANSKYSEKARVVARALLALAAERRTPGTVEVCSHCRRPLTDVTLKCSWTKEAGVNCPLEPFRKPPTAAGEGG